MPARRLTHQSGPIRPVATPSKPRVTGSVPPSMTGREVACPHCGVVVPVRVGSHTVGFNILAGHAVGGGSASVRAGRPHCPGSGSQA